jgi:DNA (cytosine-5)-methyltransferase 1
MTAGTELAQPDLGTPVQPDTAADSPPRPLAELSVPFAEFFAGIGLVRTALEPLGFAAKWANDIEKMKQFQYVANHPADAFKLGDVREVRGHHLPRGLELATSSFPCIDLSLAGNRQGLAGEHSGMFWEFARVIEELRAIDESNQPRVVFIENVTGFASSHGGKDLRSALEKLKYLGYSCDLLTIDAKHFVPQSRPRMFVVGIKGELPKQCRPGVPPVSGVRPTWIRDAYIRNADLLLHYMDLPTLPDGPTDLIGIIEGIDDSDERWWDVKRLGAFLESLSPIQAERLAELRNGNESTWRTAYRRTRSGKATWEIRRDGIAGCLRTTGGGSSKQALVQAGQGLVQARWMTAREYANLMGARNFVLRGGTDNQARFGFGDAVVVDVVRWIGEHYLLPALRP